MTKLDRGKVVMFLASALVVTTCYNPNISSNGLLCAEMPAKQCPDGFVCAGGACVKTGAVGAGGSGGANGSGGMVGSGGNPGSGGGVQPPKTLGEACLITNQGQPTQSDDCDTGLLCMVDCGLGSTPHCYKVCESDTDCSQSSCTRNGPGGTPRLCETPYAACNPHPQSTSTSGCGAGLGCYLLSSEASPAGGDRTVCDCSMSAGGLGDPCTDSRGCFAGLVCPPAGSGPGAETCRRICDPAAAPSGCQAGTTCRPFGAKWGFCS